VSYRSLLYYVMFTIKSWYRYFSYYPKVHLITVGVIGLRVVSRFRGSLIGLL
ncbi:hypothetical protein L9F63_006490, partial [Diploptera punctata]